MDKPAPADYPIHDLLARRWSPRAFADQPVEREKLQSLFEAARWAPSSNNEQPWRFIVATKGDEARWNRLFACLVEGNRVWAVRAPVLVLSVAGRSFGKTGELNRHALHDTGMAVQNLAIQATALGLIVHQMAGFDAEQARKELNIPREYEPVAMMAIGYPGDPNLLPDALRERELAPRRRHPVSSLVFGGEWGAPCWLFP
ncbi:MAG: nitroreductase family protein [Nitrospira sp.]|nr:nitroreductase family protein [Nitrospira sp.]